jgi:hypothetical protein
VTTPLADLQRRSLQEAGHPVAEPPPPHQAPPGRAREQLPRRAHALVKAGTCETFAKALAVGGRREPDLWRAYSREGHHPGSRSQHAFGPPVTAPEPTQAHVAFHGRKEAERKKHPPLSEEERTRRVAVSPAGQRGMPDPRLAHSQRTRG